MIELRYCYDLYDFLVVHKVISYLIGMLRNALNQSDLRGRSDGSTWSAQEIADGLGNLVVNEKNMEVMLERDVVPLLISLLEKGGDTEKECAANTLWIIAKTSRGKSKIKETAAATEELTRLSKSSNQSVQAAAKRVLLELVETTYTQGESPIHFLSFLTFNSKIIRSYVEIKERNTNLLTISGSAEDEFLHFKILL